MRRVAVLDERGALVGVEEVEEDEEGNIQPLSSNQLDVDPGDLPLNGTYKWVQNQTAFFPLGHGMPLRSKRPPVPESYAMYLAIRTLQEQVQFPQEVADYLDWYEVNLRRRDEEQVLAKERGADRTRVVAKRVGR